jgi:hypothetical protein
MNTPPEAVTDEATPRPWDVGEHHLTRLPTDVTARGGEDWIADCGRLNGLRLEECVANAALIVEAVNSHARLLAVREAAERMINADIGREFYSSIDKLAAALAACNEQEAGDAK